MIEINLVPDIKQELIKAQNARTRVIIGSITIGVISLIVVTILSLYIFIFQAIRSSYADGQIKKGSTQLMNVTDLSKTLTIQNQLTKISELNSNKKVDSRMFNLLNAIIPPAPNDIQISELNIDSENEIITIDGQAANSYTAVEVFKKTIEGATLKYTDSEGTKQEMPIASEISISDTSYGEDSSGKKVLRFTMNFVYATELFSPASKDISIVISSGGDVTDSYVGVPKSVFTDRASDLTGEQ